MKKSITRYFGLFILLLTTVGVGQPQQKIVDVRVVSSTDKLKPGSSTPIAIELTIPAPWHINSNTPPEDFLIPTQITFKSIEGVSFGKLGFPEAEEHTFEFSDTPLQVYQGTVYVMSSLTIPASYTASTLTIRGTITYQACNDATCLPPQDQDFMATLPVAAANESVVPVNQSIFGERVPPPSSTGVEGENEIAENIKSKGYFLAFLGIFVAGLLLNLTPCVYPLIPITLSYFGGQAGEKKGNLFVMSIIYVLGMSVTYSILGVAAALTGSILGAWLQNPFVLGFIALVMITLALSMFGLYEIQVPAALANFAGQSKQGYLGTLFMGLTVGIIAAPCIGPFVLGLLTYVGKKGDPVLGFLMFFVLAMGLGTPFIFLAMFSGSLNRIPRSGAWMVWVRKIFGFVLVGMAFYFLESLFTNILWYYTLLGITAIIAGIYLAWIDPTEGSGKAFPILKNLVGIAFLFAGAFFWVSSVEGYVDYRLQTFTTSGGETVANNIILWQPYSPVKLQQAQEKQMPVMIDFFANWCIPCKELDKFTFSDHRVIELSRKFMMLKADLTRSQSTEVQQLQKQYHIKGVPTIVFLGPDGKEIPGMRVVSYVKADEFVNTLQQVLKKSGQGDSLVQR